MHANTINRPNSQLKKGSSSIVLRDTKCSDSPISLIEESAEIDREKRKNLNKKEESCFELMQEQHREILSQKKRTVKAYGKNIEKH